MVETAPKDPTARPDCFRCIHRRDVPGSSHSQCRHPAAEELHENPLAQLLALMRTGPMTAACEGIVVEGNPHGIHRGWFNWPLDFDPLWLERCSGFEERET